LDNGQLEVPTGPGIGVEPIADNLAAMSLGVITGLV
jgi:hypothetical protein